MNQYLMSQTFKPEDKLVAMPDKGYFRLGEASMYAEADVKKCLKKAFKGIKPQKVGKSLRDLKNH